MQRVLLLFLLVCAVPRTAVAQELPLTRADSITGPAPQHRPCDGQARTIRAFRREYATAKSTAGAALVGTWGMIGYVFASEAPGGYALLNCAGVRNGPAFQQVLIVERDSISNEGFWNLRWWPDHAYEPRAHDVQGNLIFLAESGGDNVETYHCRISARGTLLCFESDLHYGLEFKRMVVPAAQRPGAYYRPPSY